MRDEPDDTELEEELRRVVARIEPVPAELLRIAIGAYAWRTIDADLAEIVFDSAAGHEEAALVHRRRQGRILEFRSSSLTIEVEISGTGAQRDLIGQLLPPQRAAIEIRHGAGVMTADAGESGRFGARSLRAGPTSLHCDTGEEAGGCRVVTDWVPI